MEDYDDLLERGVAMVGSKKIKLGKKKRITAQQKKSLEEMKSPVYVQHAEESVERELRGLGYVGEIKRKK